jgi:UDP-2-acetamido-3-amino-2,3-dideoxy-glucuronate N-acetyltransferase
VSVPIALVGCGYWGKNLARNFAQLDALAYLCDADPGTLRAQAARYPHAAATTRYEDVLTDDRVRAVALATPAVMHHAQVRQALLAGKDVFVEKPLALRYDEGRELVELARARGAVLMVGHVLEYHPAVVLLKDTVARGELGRVWYAYSNRLNLGKVRREENILWSFAPHDISVLMSLLGCEPTDVSAFGATYLTAGVADVTVTNLTFSGDLRAHIFVSWLHPYKEQKLVVVGDRKMAVFDDTAREGKLKIYDKGIDWRGAVPVPRQTSETILYVDETEPLRLECEHFLSCVAARKTPLTDGESGLRVLRVLQASQMSIERGGATVSLAAVGTP